uniref:Uncharacterized protein n=1 Tax=Medicago truncatula TaxID=3880 RepID=I3SP21_MEDTR|nr:unknown [Medicago truncatula]
MKVTLKSHPTYQSPRHFEPPPTTQDHLNHISNLQRPLTHLTFP